MAGPDLLYDDIFKQTGIIRVDSVEDLFAHGWMLATQPLPKGNRLGIVTNSAGPGTTAANTAEIGGYTLPAFSANLQKRLEKSSPNEAHL